MSFLGLTLLAIMGSTPAAVAAPQTPTPPPVPKKWTVSYGLVVSGVNEKMAHANGYNVRHLADGSFQMVAMPGRVGLAKQPLIHPFESSVSHNSNKGTTSKKTARRVSYPYHTSRGTGNCGTNFNTVEQTAAHKVYAESGFTLVASKGEPVDGYWKIKLQDQNGTSYQHVDTVKSSTSSWNHTWFQLNQYGYSAVSTVAGESYVLTSAAYYCTVTSTKTQITLV